MPRIQGLQELTISQPQDVSIKSGEGYLFSLTIAWSGATAGQTLYLRDSLTAGGGTILVPISLSAAAGTLQLAWANGKRFATGLFAQFAELGTVVVEMTYK